MNLELLNYREPTEGYDEMLDESGQLRPGWETLLNRVRSFGKTELKQRLDSMRHLIRENGVTFNVYGDDDGLKRLWELDPFPLVITGKEWNRLESGLKQRVQLLELLLDDIYGAQRCLSEGWLPPDLVYGHPGFLRATHGLPIPVECRLALHSIDLVRDQSGEFFALRDRAETPGGSGYALENRLALARMMPEQLQSQGVRSLAPFFASLRETLFELAQRRSAHPRVVFLTPGTLSQTYFEQAYLAQYMGIPLVQGDDLTVRDNRVYLKLLGGLSPVDVIIKRLKDSYCDPLELRSDSVLGVPGLVQAVRAGNVIVTNGIGSGWVETPALHAYLPNLCRQFLGQDLMLKGVPTWWCGDPESLAYVLDNLDQLVIKPLFPKRSGQAIFLQALESNKRAQLKEALLNNPASFVAQKQLSLSTSPCLNRDRLVPRCTLLRTFVARGSEQYQVMPGALALTSARAGSVVASLETGASSKDTWVLDEDRCQSSQIASATKKSLIELTREGGDIPSRLADNLFWLGRYLERAEGLCRLLRSTALRLNEDSTPSGMREVRFLHYLVNPRWNPRSEDRQLDGRQRFLNLLNRAGQTDGLRPCLDSVRRLTGVVRERLSNDFWRLSNRLIELTDSKPELLQEVQSFLDDLLTTFSAFSGLITENITRGHGWRFTEIGRRIERADHMVALLKRGFSAKRREQETMKLEILLEVADASRTYRRRYPAGLQIAPVLDLLLADCANPRSVGHQLTLIARHLRDLPAKHRYTPNEPGELLLLQCQTSIQLADVYLLTREGGRRVALTQLLRELGRNLPALSDHIAKKYFTHVLLNRQGQVYGREVLP